MKGFFYLLALIFVLNSCKSSKSLVATVNQKGEEIILIPGTQQIKLKKEAFDLYFDVFPYDKENKKFYSVKIAATTNIEDLKFLSEGEISDDNTAFCSGCGLSGYRDKPYSSLFISYGHSYIMYKDDNSKRAELVKQLDNGKVRLKWRIDKVSFNDSGDYEEVDIESFKSDILYIMIFIDENLNNKIDKGEYSLLNIDFVE